MSWPGSHGKNWDLQRGWDWKSDKSNLWTLTRRASVRTSIPMACTKDSPQTMHQSAMRQTIGAWIQVGTGRWRKRGDNNLLESRSSALRWSALIQRQISVYGLNSNTLLKLLTVYRLPRILNASSTGRYSPLPCLVMYLKFLQQCLAHSSSSIFV